MLTRLGLYKLLGENPERTWPVARRLANTIAQVIAPSLSYGQERMPETGAAVVAVNHFSEIDPVIVGLNSRRTLYFMAKIELLSVPIAGELLRWTGAFAVRRGEADRDSLRVARWALENGHVVGVFTEGTRQHFGYPGPMHAGAAMLAIQESVPVVPAGIDTFGWTPKNRRRSCIVWGEPIRLELPRNGKGYKEGTAIVGEHVTRLWRIAAQAVADGCPETLPGGLRRAGTIRPRDSIIRPELPTWPVEEWAAEPLGPVYRPHRDAQGSRFARSEFRPVPTSTEHRPKEEK
jgi:1-acyl-sn-glycerol-3-phosphate acyltransferase